MTRHQRTRYQMFGRVSQFGKKHAEQFEKTSIGGQAFATVTAAVAEIEHCTAAKVRTADDGKEAKAMAREAIAEHLTDVARTARLVSTKVPGGAAKAFTVPRWTSDAGLLTAARAVIDDGRATADLLGQLGLPENFVDDLQALVDRFTEADSGREAGKLGLAAAHAGIVTAMAEASDAVHTLDVIVANTFKKDPMVLAEWDAARHWKARRAKTTGGVPIPTATPVSEPAPVETAAIGTTATDEPTESTPSLDPPLRRAS